MLGNVVRSYLAQIQKQSPETGAADGGGATLHCYTNQSCTQAFIVKETH